MRGIGKSTAVASAAVGITPACAGNSPLDNLAPRKELGSPPRVRGIGFNISNIPLNFRITPACAGNSDSEWYKSGLGRDHPRVCGE